MQPFPAAAPTLRFPRGTFKGIGGTYVACGIVCIVLSFVSIGVSLNATERCVEHQFSSIRETVGSSACLSQAESTGLLAAVSPLAIVSGVMFIVTGAIGIGAGNAGVPHRQSGLKTGFIVLCILNALIFTSNLFAGAVILPILMAVSVGSVPSIITAVSVIEGIMAFVLFILSITAASISCCCAPVVDEVKVMTMMSSSSQGHFDNVYSPQGSQTDMTRDSLGLVKADYLASTA